MTTTSLNSPGSSLFELSDNQFIDLDSEFWTARAAGLVDVRSSSVQPRQEQSVTLQVNGCPHTVTVDSRTSLLDLLRDHLELHGTKKGCDRGQCGACTVLSNGHRVNSCLTLAVSADGDDIVTIEGLSRVPAPTVVGDLHPMQAAFLEHDGFQCGYCTSGQICSAVGALDEQRKGLLSIVSFHSGHSTSSAMTDDEIRERMSGNLCRRAAYPGIVAAIRAVSQEPSA